MDAIMDLTARAVSFITAIQTTILKGCIALERENDEVSILNTNSEDFEKLLKSFIALEKTAEEAKKCEEDSFTKKSVELVWISRKKTDEEILSACSTEYAVFLCTNLKSWIDKNQEKGFFELIKNHGFYPTPFNWRETISRILFTYPSERIKLALKLQYLPVQIVLALGKGNLSPHKQRIVQTLMTDIDINTFYKTSLFNYNEIKLIKEFQPLNKKALVLLRNDKLLIHALLKNTVPLSFQQIFSLELKEIEINRNRRISEQHIATPDKLQHKQAINNPATNDPFEKAKRMDGLTALAFSGGGIRSATFNLGILQGLAGKNLLTKFDYLSTVSGGGYIGSWLAAWIKRDGSVVKVSNRLCPDKSPDPLGEELRPIKWLRMFSNYFAPDASMMSADAWTIGVTWLRNTLLNQVIIFFMLLSVLFFGNLLFVFWSDNIKGVVYYSFRHVLVYGLIFLVPVALLAGFGMHAYHSERIRWLKIKREHTNIISAIILVIAFIGAYIISAWLSSQGCKKDIKLNNFTLKLSALWPAACVLFASLILVALLGKYADCIEEFLNNKLKAWLVLIVTAIFTAAISLISICLAWTIIQKINTSSLDHKNEIEFILGFPLVLEVFSITLVARMAFLG